MPLFASDEAESTRENGRDRFERGSRSFPVRSILQSLFSRAMAENSRLFHREFTPVVCEKPLLEPCSQTLNHQCSLFRATAYSSRQKLLTFRFSVDFDEARLLDGKCPEGSTEFTPMIELCVQGSINSEAARMEPLQEQGLRWER